MFRSAKQCREHYFNFLRPGSRKGSWQLDEDYLLLVCVLSHRESERRKWCRFVHMFDGRTENSLKNRF